MIKWIKKMIANKIMNFLDKNGDQKIVTIDHAEIKRTLDKRGSMWKEENV